MKKTLIALMLAGCGAPQTLEEITADEYVRSFVEDCESVYGSICKEVRLEVSVDKTSTVCWTENGSIKRGMALSKGLIISANKKEIYQEMLDCTVFATTHIIDFAELIEKVK